MKKILAITIAMLAVMGTMASCGGNGGNAGSAENAAYQDGTYHAEAKDFDEHGWKEYVNVTVADGKITEVEFDALSEEDGSKKTDNEAYKEAYLGAGFDTYPADYTEKLEKALIEKQDAAQVDAFAGATNSSNFFKELMKGLDANMKKGDTNTVVIEKAPEAE